MIYIYSIYSILYNILYRILKLLYDNVYHTYSYLSTLLRYFINLLRAVCLVNNI